MPFEPDKITKEQIDSIVSNSDCQSIISATEFYFQKGLDVLKEWLELQVSVEQKEKLMKELSKDRKKVELGRFKGLGEMTPPQLKETTMNPKTRMLYKVSVDDFENIDTIVDNLMGKKPEKRFQFIQEQALAKNYKEIELYV
jgi:DNA gyrase/topoisomerase IV subunit B